MIFNSAIRKRIPLLAVAGALAVFIPTAHAEPIRYTGGHGDVGVKYEDGELRFRYDFGSTAILDGSPLGSRPDQYRPDEIVTVAGPSSFGMLSDSAAALFGPGTTRAYVFGLDNSTTEPFLGLAAFDPTLISGDWISPDPDLFWSTFLGRINYEFTGVNYTGSAANPQFAYFAVDSQGTAIPHFSQHTGYSSEIAAIIPGHGHYAWGFSAPGVYEIELRAWGEHVVDGYHETSGTFRFEIVPEPSSLALAGCGLAALIAASARRGLRPMRDPSGGPGR